MGQHPVMMGGGDGEQPLTTEIYLSVRIALLILYRKAGGLPPFIFPFYIS